MALPKLPFADATEDELAQDEGLLLREGVRDFGPRRGNGWRTLRR